MWCGHRQAASRQITAQDMKSSMHNNGIDGGLFGPRPCCEIPEIGVEGQVTRGSNESDQFVSRFFKNADLPEAALQGKGPPLFIVGGLLARFQQSVDGSWAWDCGGVEPVSAWQLGDSGLLEEGKQGSACVAHASSNPIQGEQGSTE